MAHGAHTTHSLEEGPSPEEPREPSDPWHIGTLWLSLDQLCQQAALLSSCGGTCPQHILWIHDLGFSHQEGKRLLAPHSPEFHFQNFWPGPWPSIGPPSPSDQCTPARGARHQESWLPKKKALVSQETPRCCLQRPRWLSGAHPLHIQRCSLLPSRSHDFPSPPTRTGCSSVT